MVLIFFGLNHFNEFPNGIADTRRELSGTRARGGSGFTGQDGSCCEISQNPRTRGLDGVEVCGREECLEKKGASFFVVEIHEE